MSSNLRYVISKRGILYLYQSASECGLPSDEQSSSMLSPTFADIIIAWGNKAWIKCGTVMLIEKKVTNNNVNRRISVISFFCVIFRLNVNSTVFLRQSPFLAITRAQRALFIQWNLNITLIYLCLNFSAEQFFAASCSPTERMAKRCIHMYILIWWLLGQNKNK